MTNPLKTAAVQPTVTTPAAATVAKEPRVKALFSSDFEKSYGSYGALINLGQATIRKIDSASTAVGEGIGSVVAHLPLIGKHISGPVAQVARAVTLVVLAALAAVASVFVAIGYTIGLFFPPFYDYFVATPMVDKKIGEGETDTNRKLMTLLDENAKLKNSVEQIGKVQSQMLMKQIVKPSALQARAAELNEVYTIQKGTDVSELKNEILPIYLQQKSMNLNETYTVEKGFDFDSLTVEETSSLSKSIREKNAHKGITQSDLLKQMIEVKKNGMAKTNAAETVAKEEPTPVVAPKKKVAKTVKFSAKPTVASTSTVAAQPSTFDLVAKKVANAFSSMYNGGASLLSFAGKKLGLTA